MKNPLNKGWEGRILNALNVLDKAAKKQKHERSYTVDGRVLKQGITVYHLEDPYKPWKVFNLQTDSTGLKNGKIDIIRGGETITKPSTKLYTSQLKAAIASVLYVNNEVAVIKRDAKERMDRLDPKNRMILLEELLKKLGKKK